MQSGFRCGKSASDHLVTLKPSFLKLCWRNNIPNCKYGAFRDLHHLGIRGRLSFWDFRPLVTSYVTGLWPFDWENDSTNKLQRVGHSHLTHAHLLRVEDTPHCEYCGRTLSIPHLLITCPCYVSIRSRHYRSNNLTHLLSYVQPYRIFSFLT